MAKKFISVAGNPDNTIIQLDSGDLAQLVLVSDLKGNVGGTGGAGGAGGGSIVYTNMSGDFIATPNNGASTITIIGLPFTLEAKHVAAGQIKKIAVTTGLVTTLAPTSIQVTGGVITLGGIDNFVTGDELVVTLIGPDKAYDTSLDAQLVIEQNPEYGHTTSVETLISESNLAGRTASATGGTATTLIDSAAAFALSNIAVGYKAYNITEGTNATVSSVDSTTQLTTGAGITAWSGDTYRAPLVNRYEINMDTYKALNIHYRMVNGASLNTYLLIYGTLDASATIDSDANWVNLSATYFGGATGINTGASTTAENLVAIAPTVPYLKFMIKLVVECSINTTPSNTYTMFIKKF